MNYSDPFFESITNDQRPVLLWNTFTGIKPDAPSDIRFYHNDKGGPVRMIITGVNSKGAPVYEEKIVQ